MQTRATDQTAFAAICAAFCLLIGCTPTDSSDGSASESEPSDGSDEDPSDEDPGDEDPSDDIDAACDACEAQGLTCTLTDDYDVDIAACVWSAQCAPPVPLFGTCGSSGDPCGAYYAVCEAGLECVTDEDSDFDYPQRVCIPMCDPLDSSTCPEGQTCAYSARFNVAACYSDDEVAPTCDVASGPQQPCPDGTRCDLERGMCG